MITAKELAEKLNLSPSAVSLALNDRPGVSKKTRRRVLEEAQKYGYTSRIRSRRSQARKTETRNIRYVIFQDTGMAVGETSFYSIVLQGVEAEAKELGFNVQVTYFDANEDWKTQLDALSDGICGIILLATEINEKHIRKFHEIAGGHPIFQLPFCLVDNSLNMENADFHADCVVSDNERGAAMAVDLLYSRGFKDVGYLRSKTRISSFDEREAGVLKARKLRGAGEDQPLHTVAISSSSEPAYIDMCEYLDAGNKPAPAYFADNDIIAAACARALKAHGYRVPEDVSVIGFDDMPLCTLFEPPLTTVGIDKQLLGKLAMKVLGDRLTEGSVLSDQKYRTSLRITSTARIIERESVIPV